MKRRSFLRLFSFSALALVSVTMGYAAPIDVTAYSAPIKVACVGDSITFGAGIGGNRTINSYPGQLGTMLGDKWKVMNFGRSGATLLNSGNLPYQKQPELPAALKFNPDVVVIMLGTNDSKAVNWVHKDSFVGDYKDLIGKFQALPSKPQIYIAYPVAVGPKPRFGIDNAGVKEEQPLLDQIAKDTGATLIDLYTPTDGQLNLFNPDQVHPVIAGAYVIAKVIYNALTGQDYTGPLPSQPPLPPAATSPAPQ